MSHNSGPYAPQTGETTAEPSTTDVARDEAAGVGQHAREAGGQVAQTAGEQARQVAAETGRQARDLFGEAQGQARDQASAQQQRAAQQLRSVADEVGQMASNGGQSGIATEFARQAADRMHGAASWLEQREPGDLLDEVRAFARRRPGTFLIGAAVAGLAAGRLTRGLKDQNSDGQQGSQPGPGRGTVSGVPAPPQVGSGAAYPASVEPGYPAAAEPGYPAAPAYPAVTEPAGPTTPAYPAEPGYPAGGVAGDDTVAYPADPVYETGPGTTAYPSEPGYEGPGSR
jgi:hypothetical protein